MLRPDAPAATPPRSIAFPAKVTTNIADNLRTKAGQTAELAIGHAYPHLGTASPPESRISAVLIALTALGGAAEGRAVGAGSPVVGASDF